MTALLAPPSIATPAPGLYRGVPAAIYHAWPALSSGRLRAIDGERTCPARVRHELDNPKAPTKQMILGCLTEQALGVEDRGAAVAGQCEGKTAGKASRRCSRAGGALYDGAGWRCHDHAPPGEDPLDTLVVTAAQAEMAGAMADAVRAHPEAAALLLGDGALHQPSAVATVAGIGLAKTRPDALGPGRVVDLKSCKSAHPEAFAFQCRQLRYHMQAALYPAALSALDVLAGRDPRAREWWWVCVENTPPHCVAVYRAPPEVLEHGLASVMRASARYRRCVRTGEWPAYPGWSDLEWPRGRMLAVEDVVDEIEEEDDDGNQD